MTNNTLIETLESMKGNQISISFSVGDLNSGGYIRNLFDLKDVTNMKDTISLSFNNVHQDCELSLNNLKEVMYNCPDTGATIVLVYSNKFYVHIYK